MSNTFIACINNSPLRYFEVAGRRGELNKRRKFLTPRNCRRIVPEADLKGIYDNSTLNDIDLLLKDSNASNSDWN